MHTEKKLCHLDPWQNFSQSKECYTASQNLHLLPAKYARQQAQYLGWGSQSCNCLASSSQSPQSEGGSVPRYLKFPDSQLFRPSLTISWFLDPALMYQSWFKTQVCWGWVSLSADCQKNPATHVVFRWWWTLGPWDPGVAIKWGHLKSTGSAQLPTT